MAKTDAAKTDEHGTVHVSAKIYQHEVERGMRMPSTILSSLGLSWDGKQAKREKTDGQRWKTRGVEKGGREGADSFLVADALHSIHLLVRPLTARCAHSAPGLASRVIRGNGTLSSAMERVLDTCVPMP
eukprot:1193674-Rhodomonas_salina.2